MATDVVNDLADNTMGTNSPEQVDLQSSSLDTLRMHHVTPLQNELQRSGWGTDDSIFSSDVDRWIGGDRLSPINAGVQPSRLIAAQRSTLTHTPSMAPSGFWYLAAMMLPVLNISGPRNWRCTPSMILNTAELFLSQAAGYCHRARSRFRRLTREHAVQDLFASAMDIIIVIYALGFLLLSMYQASVFQNI